MGQTHSKFRLDGMGPTDEISIPELDSITLLGLTAVDIWRMG